MAAGEEYLTSNAHIAYPFREDAVGLLRADVPVDYAVNPILPQACFVDGHINMPKDYLDVAGNVLYLRSIETTVADTTYEFALADANVTTWSLFSVTPGTLTGLYAVLVVDYAAAAGPVRGGIVVRVADFQAYMAGVTAGGPGGNVYFTTRLPLAERVVVARPPRMLSFAIYNNGLAAAADATGIDGAVRIVGGYNTALDVTEPTGLLDGYDPPDTTAVELDMTAGGGLGPAPCQDVPGDQVRPPMGVTPDTAGNVQVEAGMEGCYTVVPYATLGVLEIQGSCDACCQCQDYVNVLEALRQLGVRTQAIIDELDTGRTSYEDGVTHFNENLAPDQVEPFIRINGMRGPDYPMEAGWRTGRFGAPNWARVVVQIGNQWSEELTWTSGTIELKQPLPLVYLEANWESDGTGAEVGGPFPGLPCCGTPSPVINCAPWLPTTLAEGKGLSITVLYGVRYDESPAPTTWEVEANFVVGNASGGSKTLTATVTFT